MDAPPGFNKAPRIPDWLLERVALGELPARELAYARARLEREPGGVARLAKLEEDGRRTLERHPPASVTSEVRRRVRAPRAQDVTGSWRSGWGGLSLSVPVAACLALLVLATQRDLPPDEQVDPPRYSLLSDSVRIKGDPRLLVHRQGAGTPELLSDHAAARRGDLLQLSYLSGGRRYGVVVSVDGRGAVTLHHPASLAEAAMLQEGEAVSLLHAYELDDAPGFERFIFVTSDQPVDTRVVLEAARRLARQPVEARTLALPLPATLAQTSLTLEKVP